MFPKVSYHNQSAYLHPTFTNTRVAIVPKSRIARLAAIKLGSKQVALVIGHCIYLHGTTAAEFLAHEAWVNHELAHVAQYASLGTPRFLLQYLRQWIKKGYWEISFEKEARLAEQNRPYYRL